MFYAGRLQIRRKRDVDERLLHLRWVKVCWAFGAWSNTRSGCVLIVQGPARVCVPAFPGVDAGALGWGQGAGWVSYWHCLGMGSGGARNLPPVLVVPVRWAWPVSVLSVHQKPVPRVELWESLAAGRGGGFQVFFGHSLVSLTLRFCQSVSVSGSQLVAGVWVLVSCCALMTAVSHCPLSPLACVIFKQLFCVKPFGYGSCKQLDWLFQKLMLTLELSTDSSVHFLILTTIYLQSQGPSQLVT